MKTTTKPQQSKVKPSYVQVAKAVNYWVVFYDIASFFDKARMPAVSQHLLAACKEIDRIWEEGDYEHTRNRPC